ncbi:MAG: pyridoxal 5'-phosphate synthase glutaminase subunit PdxT [Candidatus Latescibacteria bacterium]|nr:pyridoxal 5'-phosphate synthase glutaminase subunit PdxT [Candidatus Latescibacterota bacterium]
MECRTVGVLGLQGDYQAHIRMLERAGAPAQVVKKPDQLDQVHGLIMPGGESTTLIKLMDAYSFWEPLQAFAGAGKPILGTCAGMILLAGQVLNPAQKSLGLIDVTVERNSYGRQIDSFEGVGTFTGGPHALELPMVFIRAPRLRAMGPGVESLATCNDDCVMARQGSVLVASFHPELTGDLTVHRYFLDLVGA